MLSLVDVSVEKASNQRTPINKIVAVAKESMMSERAQAVAKETGALVYWQDAADSAARIENDIATMARIGGLLE